MDDAITTLYQAVEDFLKEVPADSQDENIRLMLMYCRSIREEIDEYDAIRGTFLDDLPECHLGGHHANG